MFSQGQRATAEQLRSKLGRFRDLVEQNDHVLELIADAGEKLGGEYVFDTTYLRNLADGLKTAAHTVAEDLNAITHGRYAELNGALAEIDDAVAAALECRMVVPAAPWVLGLAEVGIDQMEIVGAKMARLGEVGNRLGCQVPEGFVVTTRACRELLAAAGVLERVEALGARHAAGDGDVEEGARVIREAIRATPLPRELSRALEREVRRLTKPGEDDVLFAVRSSAVEEDGELSFAGQYETVLGVTSEGIADAYRTVVASLYSSGVLDYMHRHRVAPHCNFMAVGVLRMVPARASGVAYSVDPSSPERNVLLVSAARGLGKLVVEGGEPVDRLEVSRDAGHEVVAAHIATKRRMFVALHGEGTVEAQVPDGEGRTPALAPWETAELSAVVCRVERYMRSAQDVEWAIDHTGRLWVLQARPLHVAPVDRPSDHDLSDVLDRYPVLLQARGEVACRGIGSGPVHVVSEADVRPEDIPPGAVIVARAATPKLGSLLAGASAVVTDLGSATGHFAAVARDFRVPTLVDTGCATSLLEEGEEVTVDAEDRVVYAGRVEELLRYQLLAMSSFESSAEFRILRRMLRRIAPLHLRDPTDARFSARRCTTYHDVIRFAHEKAIAALTNVGWVKTSRDVAYVRRVSLPIPLDLMLIDLGGGFRATREGAPLLPSDVTSRPLTTLLDELCAEDVWQTTPASMDLDGFMSSATRSMSLTGPMSARPEQNLAIASAEYLHLSLRLGYHFNIVDTYLGDAASDNYIYFRFTGGVTELARRSRRAALLRRVLEGHGFVTEGHGDLVVGRIKGLGAAAMVERLRMVGRLIGFTRQLDIHLKNDRLVDLYVERFMAGDAPVKNATRPEGA